MWEKKTKEIQRRKKNKKNRWDMRLFYLSIPWQGLYHSLHALRINIHSCISHSSNIGIIVSEFRRRGSYTALATSLSFPAVPPAASNWNLNPKHRPETWTRPAATPTPSRRLTHALRRFPHHLLPLIVVVLIRRRKLVPPPLNLRLHPLRAAILRPPIHPRDLRSARRRRRHG